MNIILKATNTTLTGALKRTVNDKLSFLDSFVKPEHKIHVELEVLKRHKSGMVQRAEISITPGNHYAEALGNDFYEALDLVLPKIKEQLVKNKGKKLSQRRQVRNLKRSPRA